MNGSFQIYLPRMVVNIGICSLGLAHQEWTPASHQTYGFQGVQEGFAPWWGPVFLGQPGWKYAASLSTYLPSIHPSIHLIVPPWYCHSFSSCVFLRTLPTPQEPGSEEPKHVRISNAADIEVRQGSMNLEVSWGIFGVNTGSWRSIQCMYQWNGTEWNATQRNAMQCNATQCNATQCHAMYST